jgi:hypothetical protein
MRFTRPALPIFPVYLRRPPTDHALVVHELMLASDEKKGGHCLQHLQSLMFEKKENNQIAFDHTFSGADGNAETSRVPQDARQ